MIFLKTERKTRSLREGEERKHFETLNTCYNPWGKYEEWNRRYKQFPEFDLTKNVLIVEESGEWAGGATAWFREAFLSNDKKISVYEAGDLYVLPAFRGKGIYSMAMRSLNEMAQKRGAVLGFGFPSVYGVAATALPKYGFADVFYPVTKILLLKPERFLGYFLSRLEEFVVPPKLNGLKIRLIVPFDKKNARVVSKMFHVENGQLKEVEDTAEVGKIDLTIKAEIELLNKASSLFYRRKKTLYLHLFFALLRRRLGFRFSLRFLKAFLGL